MWKSQYKKDYSDEELTPKERQRFREMADEYDKRAWAVALVVRVIGWGSAIIGFLAIVWDNIKDVAKTIAGS